MELLNAYGASPCKLLPQSSSSTNETEGTVNSTTKEQQHIDLQDVTHIITMTMQFQDHQAVEVRNNQVLEEAASSGKQISTAPNASTGRRGDLIALVTVSYYFGLIPFLLHRHHSNVYVILNSFSHYG